jgi:hypothetical protein
LISSFLGDTFGLIGAIFLGLIEIGFFTGVFDFILIGFLTAVLILIFDFDAGFFLDKSFFAGFFSGFFFGF